MTVSVPEGEKYVGKWVLPKRGNLNSYVGRHGHHHDYERISRDIKEKLDLNPNDKLLDIACGNALITIRLAKYVKSVVGIDFSEVLIGQAQELKNDLGIRNIEYKLIDLFSINNEFKDNTFDKLYCYSTWQHFDEEEAATALRSWLRVVRPGGSILVGDIPNKNRVWRYKISTLKSLLVGGSLKSYLKRKSFRGLKKHFGSWWTSGQLISLCEKLGQKGEVIHQDKKLPLSHYRFDLLIKSVK